MSVSDIRFDIISDVSVPNEHLAPIEKIDMTLAAAIWIAPGISRLQEKRAALLQNVLQKLSHLYDRREIWLLTAHRLYQPDNRIIRYFGLWKSLKRDKLDLPLRAERFETLHEAKAGIKFFGAVRMEAEDSTTANQIMMEKSTWIALLDGTNSRETVESLLASGWTTDDRYENPPIDILAAVAKAEGVLIAVFGRFDDPEVAVAAYGQRETIGGLRFVGQSMRV